MALVAYITNAGASLISECVGGTLVFTRAKLGTNAWASADNCRSRGELKAESASHTETDRVENAIVSRVVGENGAAKVTVKYSNASQEGTFSVKELGIYGKKEGSDSDVMVCYAKFDGANETDDILPSSASLFARMYEIVIAVSGVAEISVTVPSDTYPVVTGGGLLYVNENGEMSAVALDTLAPANHTHAASAIVSGMLPVSRGGTGASDASSALQNLGIIYSATAPSPVQNGAIWLQPIS